MCGRDAEQGRRTASELLLRHIPIRCIQPENHITVWKVVILLARLSHFGQAKWCGWLVLANHATWPSDRTHTDLRIPAGNRGGTKLSYTQKPTCAEGLVHSDSPHYCQCTPQAKLEGHEAEQSLWTHPLQPSLTAHTGTHKVPQIISWLQKDAFLAVV